MNHAQTKMRARRIVHRQFAVPVVYYRKGQDPLPGLTARLHNKVTVDKDPTNGGYATTVDADTRVIFMTEQLIALQVVPVKGDRLFFPDYGISVFLNTKATPGVGPLLQKWTVEQR